MKAYMKIFQHPERGLRASLKRNKFLNSVLFGTFPSFPYLYASFKTIKDKDMTVVERFLKYVIYNTQSDETTGTTPSTSGQRVFAEALVDELKEIGLTDISLISTPVPICRARTCSRASSPIRVEISF